MTCLRRWELAAIWAAPSSTAVSGWPASWRRLVDHDQRLSSARRIVLTSEKECTAPSSSRLTSLVRALSPIRRQASLYWPLRAAFLLLVVLTWMLCPTADLTAPPAVVAPPAATSSYERTGTQDRSNDRFTFLWLWAGGAADGHLHAVYRANHPVLPPPYHRAARVRVGAA
jgi:hypothetical protein